MTYTKLPPMGSSQSSTTLPPIGSKHQTRATSSIQRATSGHVQLVPAYGNLGKHNCHLRVSSGLTRIASGKVTVLSQIPDLTTDRLPPLENNCHALMKQYEDLLNEHMKNEALIEKKEKDIENQIKEMDDIFEQSDIDRIENEKATRTHSSAMKMLDDIQTEIARAKIRESEQELELTGQENTNLQKRQELRRLTDDITELQKRIERGPDFIKEEIERFIDVIASIEMENEDFDVEIKRKAAELNDLRIELIMKDSDSESEEDDDDIVNEPRNDRQITFEDGQKREDILKIDGNITPSLNLQNTNQANIIGQKDKSNELTIALRGLNDTLTLPSIHQKVMPVNEKIQTVCNKPILKPRQVLPAINGVHMNKKSNNPTEFSRNILHRGTTESTKSTQIMGFLPKPPSARLPTVGYRRRRANKS